jgi:hypothetical protein
MNCASRRNALIELAATGGEPVSELRAHLHQCPSCRAVFESERNLFTAIDAGLRAGARVEVPTSLLPRVRTRLDESPRYNLGAAHLRKITLAIVAAAILLLSINSLRHPKRPQTPSRSPSLASPSSIASQPLTPSPQLAAPERDKNRFSERRRIQRQSPGIAPHGDEILVPPDQEILLAKYASQLSRRRTAGPVVAVQSAPPDSQPLEIALIQIAELDVKPLAERQE